MPSGSILSHVITCILLQIVASSAKPYDFVTLTEPSSVLDV